MTDLDKWKNFADYNYEVEEEEEFQKKKQEVILKATLPSVTFVLIIIGLFVFKRQVLDLKARMTEWFTVAMAGLGINIWNRVSLSLDAIPSLGLESNLRDLESGSVESSVYPGSIFDSGSGQSNYTPPRERYQSNRPLNLPMDQRGSADLRDMASLLVRPFFADPLPMFEFGSSSGTLSIGDEEFVTSTQIQSKTYTVPQPDEKADTTHEVRIPLRCLSERRNDGLREEESLIEHDSLDTLDLMESNSLKQLDLTDGGSNGSVIAFKDLMTVRELPKRSTRNKQPIYVAPSSENEE